MVEEAGGVGVMGWIRLGWWILGKVWRSGGVVERKEWRRRLRVCRKCPVYDFGLKRCRPWSGSKLGCGCFVPFLAKLKEPYRGGCWADENLPGEDFGWGFAQRGG